MKNKLLAAVAIHIALMNAPVFADDPAEVAALKQEVKALEARLAELEKREQARQQQQPAQPTAYKAAPGASSDLAKRVAIVERHQEIAKETAQAKVATTPTVEVGSKGLIVTSPDKQHLPRTRVWLSVQADNRAFMDGGAKSWHCRYLPHPQRPAHHRCQDD